MLDQELHFMLLRAFHHSNRRVQQNAAENGLYPGQPKILEYLIENDGCIARDICQGCVLDKSTMTSLLARMEKQGLIMRKESAGDRRAQHIYMTRKGREVAETIKAACIRIDEAALAGIPQADREVFLLTLKQIIRNLEEDVI